MNKIRKLAFVLFTILLSGCSTLSTHQTACEEKHPHFIQMVKCLKSEVHNDKFITASSADLLKLYLAYADALAERVKHGTMTETDARLALAQMLTSINQESANRSARMSAVLNASLQSMAAYQAATQPVPIQPIYRPITCHQMGAFITCN